MTINALLPQRYVRAAVRQETSAIDVELDDGTRDEPYLARLSHSLDVVLAGQLTVSEAG